MSFAPVVNGLSPVDRQTDIPAFTPQHTNQLTKYYERILKPSRRLLEHSIPLGVANPPSRPPFHNKQIDHLSSGQHYLMTI